MRTTNREALQTLVDFLKTADGIKLRMTEFAQPANGRYSTLPYVIDCGTPACVVGHAPLAGLTEHLDASNWSEYSYRTFFNDPDVFYGPETDDFYEASNLWGYMFSMAWPDSVFVAIDRLEHVIEHDARP